MVLQIKEPSSHYDLISNFPTHCYFSAFWRSHTSVLSPMVHFDFCKLRCLHCLVLQDFLLAASTGCPDPGVFQANSAEKRTPTPQGLMISCKSPSPKDNRWKLSRRLTTGTVMGFLPSRGSANRKFEATGVTALIRLIPFWVTTGWWFQTFFIFTLTWGNDPIWLIFVRWVETTNQTMSLNLRLIFSYMQGGFLKGFLVRR